MPDDRIKVGGHLMRIKEYTQMPLTNSIMLHLAYLGESKHTCLLTLDNTAFITIYNQKK